jgi:hypothetical protein
MDDTNEARSQHTNPRFYDLCLTYEFDDQALQEIANISGMHKSVVDAMFVSVLVRRADALKVLAAFSQYTGKAWNLDNVKVALIPTFQELHTTHNFDLATLSTHSGVPLTTLDMLLNDQPIPTRDARLVLQMASRLTGQDYTLETVDIKLTDGSVQS